MRCEALYSFLIHSVISHFSDFRQIRFCDPSKILKHESNQSRPEINSFNKQSLDFTFQTIFKISEIQQKLTTIDWELFSFAKGSVSSEQQ